MLSILLFVLFHLFAIVQLQQLISPCPNVFQYEPLPSRENDRWYGVITLNSETELSGVWMRLTFNRESIQLGNWFGEVIRREQTGYLVKNPSYKVRPNSPFTVRFFVKYNPSEPAPQLVEIRLNGKTLCPDNGAVTVAPQQPGQLITSSEWTTTTAMPFSLQGNEPVKPGNRPTYQPDDSSSNSGGDDDFFQGDFALFNRPKPQFTKPSSVVVALNDNSCGTVIKSPKPLITYGQATQEGEFPWHAALYRAKGADLTYICGASLISRYHLITVAHCVTNPKTKKTISPDSLLIYLGKYYLKRWGGNPGLQDKHVESIKCHPEYNGQTFANDIAIIKTDSAVEITNYVRPVCLWLEDVSLQKIVNKLGTVVGWGFDETGKVTEQLTKAQMPVVSQETCIYSFPDFYSMFTSNRSFCAGFLNGTSVCNGDSGGGMVFPKSQTGSNGQQVWQLRGLVSISVALQNTKCDSSHYVVYTDVAKFLDWIKASLN